VKKKVKPKPAIKFRARIENADDVMGMHFVSVPARIVEALGGKPRVRLIGILTESLLFLARSCRARKKSTMHLPFKSQIKNSRRYLKHAGYCRVETGL